MCCIEFNREKFLGERGGGGRGGKRERGGGRGGKRERGGEKERVNEEEGKVEEKWKAGGEKEEEEEKVKMWECVFLFSVHAGDSACFEFLVVTCSSSTLLQ